MSGPFRAAAAEAKAEPLHLEALGGKFALGPGPDAIAWLELAAAAGKSSRSHQGALAFLDFAKACFTDESWPQFRAAVRDAGITEQAELEEIVGQALELITGRPTTPSSHSDSGSSTTSPASTETTTSPVAAAS